MRKPIKEIQNVLDTHGYSINNIIFDAMKTFKFKSLCSRVGFQKKGGLQRIRNHHLDVGLTPDVAEKRQRLVQERISKGYHHEKGFHLSLEKQRNDALEAVAVRCS